LEDVDLTSYASDREKSGLDGGAESSVGVRRVGEGLGEGGEETEDLRTVREGSEIERSEKGVSKIWEEKGRKRCDEGRRERRTETRLDRRRTVLD